MQLTPNYKTEDFDCNDGTPVPLQYYPNVKALADNLEILNDELGVVVKVTGSGYRTKSHNAKVSHSSKSQHLTASAGDVSSKKKTALEIYKTAEKLMAEGKMTEGGLGLYNSFVHYDIRGTKARWKF